MRLSQYPLATTKETPADAEVASHKLLLRAGYIRMLGKGLYTWMPIGLRVLRKVEAIVREEMNRAGAHEVLMPSIHPAELWQESGRWEEMGHLMLRIKDRHDRDYCYGPTHEEGVTFAEHQIEVGLHEFLEIHLYLLRGRIEQRAKPVPGKLRARLAILPQISPQPTAPAC
jgi:prolyl-tRNA synthetase